MTDSKGSETPRENAASVADAASGSPAKTTAQKKKTASGGTSRQAKTTAKTVTGAQAKKVDAAKNAAADTQTAPAKEKASGTKKTSTPPAASGKKAPAATAQAPAAVPAAQESEAKATEKKAASPKGSRPAAAKTAKAPAAKSTDKAKAVAETAEAAPKKAKGASTAKASVKTAPAVESSSAKTPASSPEANTASADSATEKTPRAAQKGQSRAKSAQRPRGGKSSGHKKSVPAPEAAAEKQQGAQAASPESDLLSSLPPFYAPQNLAVSTQTEHGKAPSPFAVVPSGDASAPSAGGSISAESAAEASAEEKKGRGIHSSRSERSGKEARQEIAAEAGEAHEEPADAVEATGAEGENGLSGGTPSGERKRRSRGRGRRGRKKNGEEAAVAEVETAEAESLDPADDTDETEQESPGKSSKSGKDKEDLEALDKKGRRKMFVSVLPGEQVEVAIAEEGQVREYYVEMLHQAKTKGNIYKATIHNVDANLQAVFVSYGAVKNGFLQIDEIHPEYYNVPHDPNKGRKYPPIQKVLKTGQELLVQVVKEPAGTKGAFLTTYLSLPGRYLVLTPGREQIGVSRKVEQDGERSRLREMLDVLSPGPGLGVIVRTASMGASKTNLQRDLQYLKRLWKDVRKRGTEEKVPCLIYQEMDLTTRATRDYLTDDITEVWIDDAGTYDSLTDLAGVLFPRKQNLVRLHKDPSLSLFERFNIQRQIDQIHSREVSLPSGGQLVIDPTEALTAIDINSGRSGGKSNFEDMAYRTNMEAARMIPLQLRLRDIGGQVVADFIEMRDKAHWREVEKTLRAGMKEDRARYDVGKIGPFGMLEIVRQRLGSSAISISTEICPFCKGTGVRRNAEWRSQQALREIQRELRAAVEEQKSEIMYAAEPDLALHLLNHKRERLMEMEKASGVRLEITFKHNDV